MVSSSIYDSHKVKPAQSILFLYILSVGMYINLDDTAAFTCLCRVSLHGGGFLTDGGRGAARALG